MVAGIKSDSVTQWFVDHIPDVHPPLTFTLIAGGRSNLTFKVTDMEGQGYVLRRPPTGHILESAHDMGREFKIISSLGHTDIPVAPTLGLCRDKAVNDADFYVMRFVAGRVFGDSVAGSDVPFDKRRGIGFHALDVLIRLHRVNPDDIGLGDLGQREDYAGRQVRRWIKQWENSKTEEMPEMEKLGNWLRENIPAQEGSAIVHGDFRLGNFILQDHRIAAVLDWELCTLGDPRADVGWLLNWWYSADEVNLGQGDQAPTAVGGYPTREELIDYYQRETGRDLSCVNYYRALSYWKLAVIAQGVYQRFLTGAMGDISSDRLSLFKGQIQRSAKSALAMIC